MKNALFKILPVVLGIGLGWVILHPPDWPAPSGAAGILAAGLILFAILVASIVFQIGLTLPKGVTLTPYAGPVDPSMNEFIRAIKDLGFAETGSPMIVGIRPPALLAAFVHPGEPVYATVFRTGTMPAATSYDFVSVFEGLSGGLTTSANGRGGTMPAGPGAFRQILRSAGPKEAFEAHLEGLRWLGDRGLPLKRISVGTFAADFTRSLGLQREAFRKSPVKFAVVALWRTVSKRVPETRLLSAQKGAEARTRGFLMSGQS